MKIMQQYNQLNKPFINGRVETQGLARWLALKVVILDSGAVCLFKRGRSPGMRLGPGASRMRDPLSSRSPRRDQGQGVDDAAGPASGAQVEGRWWSGWVQ